MFPRTTSTLAILSLSLWGCSASPPRIAPRPSELPSPIEVVSYGRYRLLELGANDAQSDLMNQVVDITFPTRQSDMSVLDALHVVLNGSGYSLCDDVGESHAFASLALPAVHRTLGPIRLRQALTTLIGRGWLLVVNEQARQVCVSGQ